MNESKKPHIKLILTRNSFNTLVEMLRFFVASETQAGETFYSRTSARLIDQFIRYGNFIEKKNEDDNLFLIYLYENEIVKMLRLYNKYVGVHQNHGTDYYAEFKRDKT